MNLLRSFAAFFATLLLVGTSLTLFLTILTGGTETSILKHFYWLETNCAEFPGAPFQRRCRWTNYSLCAVSDNGNNVDCTGKVAAYPFSPAKNFDSDENLPDKFVNNANYYYYTSRVGWGFTLVGLAFSVFSWFPFVAILFVKNKIKLLNTTFWTLYALCLVFTVAGISLSTASFAKGRSNFRDAGYFANFGTKTMAVAWVSVFLVLFNLPFLIGAVSKYNYSMKLKPADTFTPSKPSWFKRKHASQSEAIANPGTTATPAYQPAGTTSANYLSFTPVKEANTNRASADHLDAEDTI